LTNIASHFGSMFPNVMNPKERRNERITPVREYLEIN
jgi:hypothetical protein